jgi:hypothetical protein
MALVSYARSEEPHAPRSTASACSQTFCFGDYRPLVRHTAPTLTALEPYGPHKLDKQHARVVARKVAEVQDALREPEVRAIIQVALLVRPRHTQLG